MSRRKERGSSLGCRKLATSHLVKTVNVAFNRLLRMLTDQNLHIRVSHGLCYVMSRVPLSQSECLLNKSMGVAQNVSAIAMRCCREQIANCFQLWTHCADRSRADVIYNMSQDIPIMLHAAKYSGATGSGPMQINNDQSRVENRVSRLENRQPVAMRKSISRLTKHIYLNGNHVEIMFS